ncbi:MAG TPA: hypothetical protein VGX21_04590 [Methylomirabilota bacterium]|jgi:hypothetical protein|nr:hypothetical protein [Methylomirabilota bacterium]
MRYRTPTLLLGLALLTGAVPLAAQPAATPLRLALVSQWVIAQHRASGHSLAPELRHALDAGVVERPVFRWQHGLIQRRALVWKPIRVLPADEAAALGGLGEFQLARVGPPSGGGAWTTVEVTVPSGRPDGVLILEVGGEIAPVSQVLETLALVPPTGGFQELRLVRRALVPADGVLITRPPFGRPVGLPAGATLRGSGGVEFLVARSPVEAIENGGLTANGPADLSPVRDAVGEWREGDRVFIRIAASTLQAGAPAILFGWKDRIYREGGPDLETPRSRARLPGPFVH